MGVDLGLALSGSSAASNNSTHASKGGSKGAVNWLAIGFVAAGLALVFIIARKLFSN
jgi:hypothetical protein